MQLGSWDVEVGGESYAVRVERGESGKDIVRVNGRVATKPIGPEEAERSIDVGGRPYNLRRQGKEKYDLVPGEAASPGRSPAAPASERRERDESLALGALAKSSAPVALPRDPFFKRLPLIAWVAIVGLIGVLMYVATGPGYEKLAMERVKRVLSEMHEVKDSQFAVSYWYRNKKVLDSLEMSAASDNFDRWRSKKDLYRKIGDFQVLDAEIVKGEPTPTAIVHVKIEGVDYRMKVPKDLPISWVD